MADSNSAQVSDMFRCRFCRYLHVADSNSAQEIIDKLIKHWLFWGEHEKFYLERLAPSLVSDISKGDDFERDILAKLKKLLNESEWNMLSQLIKKTRYGVLWESESERRCKEEAEKAIDEKRREERRIANRKRQKEAREKKRRDSLFQELRERFASDYLKAEKFYKDECSQVISEDEFRSEKIEFVRSWLVNNTGEGTVHNADDEQLAAISTVNGHVQVTARAGSGKTTTLVYRAFFLIKHCGVSPGEMLLLAFNKKAAVEMQRRLLALFDPTAESSGAELEIELPHVMTFHALANAIVHPEKPPLHDDPDGDQAFSRKIQELVKKRLKVPKDKKKIRDLMLAYFREDWEDWEGWAENVKRWRNQNREEYEEYLAFRRSLRTESLRGDYVKSYGEKRIANFLFEHGVGYSYEKSRLWGGRNYRPDFTIHRTDEGGKWKNSGVVIEYFGMEGDDKYDKQSRQKRDYWEDEEGWSLIEFSNSDVKEDDFESKLKKELEKNDIRPKRLSDRKIWKSLLELGIKEPIARFTRAMKTFVGRCRKKSLTPSDLREKIDSHKTLSSVEGNFLELGRDLYTDYLKHLAKTGQDDFDGLMQKAAARVNDGSVSFERETEKGDLSKLRHIFIDEFQDFSDLFYRLISAIFKVNPSVELFCVGDDWQAINGFAGSELRFFENFEEYIGTARRLNMRTNYRSHSTIVSIGNALMRKPEKPQIEAQARSSVPAGNVWLADLEEFRPDKLEQQMHWRDTITPAVLRVVQQALTDRLDVVILCHTNYLSWFINYPKSNSKEKSQLPKSNSKEKSQLDEYLEHIKSFFQEESKEKRITISTAHKYKGLEKPMVIVLDAVASSYPLIHPNWIFSRILGDTPETITCEERRLFYVALTRAIDSLVIFTEKKSKSLFLEELEGKGVTKKKIAWGKFPPVRGRVVEIRNQDGQYRRLTKATKDYLRKDGYNWDRLNHVWVRGYSFEEFKECEVSNLKSQSWAKHLDGMQVRIYDETESDTYYIDGGNWDEYYDSGDYDPGEIEDYDPGEIEDYDPGEIEDYDPGEIEQWEI